MAKVRSSTKLILMDPKDIKVGERFRKEFGDIDSLAESIRDHGLVQLPVVDMDGKLVAGERRLRALEKLGEKRVECLMMDVKDPVMAQIVENLDREGWSPSEKVVILKRLTGQMRRNGGVKWERVARALGWSPGTTRKADHVVRAAKRDPKRFKRFENRIRRTGKVDGAFRAMRRKEREIHGIETKYKGVTFRSQTEARWAAVFDLAKIRWQYEPPEEDGWIPDFKIWPGGQPRLVEVKAHTEFEYLFHDLEKIEHSGSAGQVWKLGGRIFSPWPPEDPKAVARVVGLVREFGPTARSGSWTVLTMPPQWADWWNDACHKVQWKSGGSGK